MSYSGRDGSAGTSRVPRVAGETLGAHTQTPASSEEDRLQAVERLGLFGTDTDAGFCQIVELAAAALGTPIALMSLVGRDRMWFAAKVGLEMSGLSCDQAFCAHAIAAGDDQPFVVADALADPRFVDSTLVAGTEAIRSYAGQVVRDREGYRVGTLCVLDRARREFDQHQQRILMQLAALAEHELRRIGDMQLIVQLDTAQRNKSLIVTTLDEGLVFHDRTGAIIEWNPAAERVLGLSGDELCGRTSADPRWLATHPDGTIWPGDSHPAMVALRTGEPVTGAVMGIHRPDGSAIWVRVNAQPIRDISGAVTAVLAVFVDITEEHRLAQALTRFRFLFEHSNDIIIVLDSERTVRYATPSLTRILGVPTDQPDLAAALEILTHPDDRSVIADGFSAVRDGAGHGEPFTVRVRDRRGSWRHLEFLGVNLLDEPAVAGVVLTARDVTDRELLACELTRRATHDSLTGLANRALFEQKVAEALLRAEADGHTIAVCYLDLDLFKNVNDTYGHSAGDNVLRAFAGRLRTATRPGDLAARIGGDEFAMLLTSVHGPDDALAIATRLRHSIVAPEPEIRTSIGVALNTPGDTPDDLLRRADTAQYTAKAARNSAVHMLHTD